MPHSDRYFLLFSGINPKYEDVLRAYDNGRDLQAGLTRYFEFYNCRRLHQSHEYQTPDEVYYAAKTGEPMAIAA